MIDYATELLSSLYYAASFCVSGGVRGSAVLLQWLFVCNGHISPWCRLASLCQAPRHMVTNFPPGWMKTTSA